MKQVHLLISGFVQGIGYRNFVRHNAKKLGLVGWVRNLSGDRVEVVAQGEEKSLERLIQSCRKGPFLAEVKDVEVEWQTPSEKFETFKKIATV